MASQTQTASAGFPIIGVLGLIFVTLKLTGTISWSWLWVLSPFWIPFVPLVLILLIWGGATLASKLTKR